MKTTLTLSLLSIFLITTQAYSQSIGINGDGSTPDSNTMLDIKSTGSTSVTYGLKVKDATGTANMVVRDDGNVGIGTTGPVGDGLTVVGGAGGFDILTLSRGGIGQVKVHAACWSPQIVFNQSNTDLYHIGYNQLSCGPGTISPFSISGSGGLTGNEIISFTQAGKVGIETTNPQEKLHIKVSGTGGDGNDGLLISATSDRGAIRYDGNQSLLIQGLSAPNNGSPGSPTIKFQTRLFGQSLKDQMVIMQNGNIGIGTTSPTQRLTVFNGTTTGTYTTTGWAHSSDRRLKTNIQTIDNALDKVQALNGVSFDWKNSKDEPRQIGFIAQEVEQVLPEVVLVDSLGNYSMAYGNLTAVLVNAIKEQQHTIQKLEAVVAQEQAVAEKREATLEARMQTLEEIIRLTER